MLTFGIVLFIVYGILAFIQFAQSDFTFCSKSVSNHFIKETLPEQFAMICKFKMYLNK